ncbi:MAG TPA: Clp protease N-terminal domain-containing protein [Blastocatellia bacterium]|nr:Clp protease N-terminal domain-containing protein [Blastocatellia bacterium]
MIEFGSMTDKFSETGQKVVRRAMEVSKSRDHNFLSMLHVFTALGEVESGLFVEAIQAVGVDPPSVTRLVEQEMAKGPVHVGKKVAIPEATRDLFNRALRRARSQGRLQIESYDLFASLFTDLSGPPSEILRRLGVDPASATETISQCVRSRESRSESFRNQMKGRIALPLKFPQLTASSLKSIVALKDMGVVPEMWDHPNVSLTSQEQRQVEVISSYLLNHRVALMNEATIWSRAIYPMLVLAEQGGLEAWAQAPLKAQYSGFGLEGVVDGVVGHNPSGITKSFYLIVVKVAGGLEAKDPQIQLYGSMLAAARLNWENDKKVPQEIFGCYTIADNWTFMKGLVSDIEDDRPTMTVASSREYSEKIEAETILRILKYITGKYAQELTDTP